MPSTIDTSRRDILALAGTVMVAGCLNRSDSSESETPTSTEQPVDETPTTRYTPTDTATPTAEPATEPSVTVGPVSWTAPSAPPTESWPLPRYDAGNTRTAPAENGPTSGPVEQVWEQSFAGSTISLPVADTDGIYVSVAGEGTAPRTTIARLTPARGERTWAVERDRPIESSPVLDNTELFVALGSGTIGVFATADGTSRTVSVPAARYDREFLATGGLIYVTDEENDLHVLDAGSGDRSFTFDAGTIAVDAPVAGDIQDWSVKGFAVDEDHVYVAAAAHHNDELPPDLGRVYALNPTAETIAWTTRLAPESPTNPTPAREIAVRNGTVYVASERGLWAFDAADGTRVWARDDLGTDLWASQLTVTSQRVIVTSASTVWGVDATTGKTQWTIELPLPRGIAVTGTTLFLASRPRDAATATLLALDTSGSEQWRYEVAAPLESITPAHGRLYADTSDGRILAFA